MWPFKYSNGEQTPESEALQSDKTLHQPVPFDLNQFEDAPL